MATVTNQIPTKSDKCEEKSEHSEKAASTTNVTIPENQASGDKISSLFDNEQGSSRYKGELEKSVSKTTEERSSDEDNDDEDYYDDDDDDDDDSQMQIDESPNFSPPETVIYPPLLKDQIKTEVDTDSIIRLQKRRETNRRAAQKCRQKQTEREAILRREFLETESRNTRLNYEILKLRRSKEILEEILRNHFCVIKKPTINSPENSTTETSKLVSPVEISPQQRTTAQPVTPVEISPLNRTSQPVSPVDISPQSRTTHQPVSHVANNLQPVEISPQRSSTQIKTVPVTTLSQAFPIEIYPQVITPQSPLPPKGSPLPVTVVNVDKNTKPNIVQMEKQPVLVSKPISNPPETYSTEIPTFISSPSPKLTHDGFKIPQSVPKKMRSKKGLRQINAEELQKILRKGGRLLPVKSDDMDKGISLKHHKLKAIYSRKPPNVETVSSATVAVGEKRKLISPSLTELSKSNPNSASQVHEGIDISSRSSKIPKGVDSLYQTQISSNMLPVTISPVKINSAPKTPIIETKDSIPYGTSKVSHIIASASSSKVQTGERLSKEEMEEMQARTRTSIAATALLELNQHGLERVHSTPLTVNQNHQQTRSPQVLTYVCQPQQHFPVGSPRYIQFIQPSVAASGIAPSSSNVQVVKHLSGFSSPTSEVVQSGQHISKIGSTSQLVYVHPEQQVLASGVSLTRNVGNPAQSSSSVNSISHIGHVHHARDSNSAQSQDVPTAQQGLINDISHSRNVNSTPQGLVVLQTSSSSSNTPSVNVQNAPESSINDASHSESVPSSVHNLTDKPTTSASIVYTTSSYISNHISPTKTTSSGTQYMKRRDFHLQNELRRTQNEAVQKMLRKAAASSEQFHSNDTDKGLQYRPEQRVDVVQNDSNLLVKMNK